jgi:hypothetical protein
MKTLKINILTILLLFISISILDSCKNENDEIIDTTLNYELSVFKKNFPCEYKNIGIENIQQVIANKSNGDNSNINGITFPVIEEGKVIGRYIGLIDQTSCLFIDFSDYTHQVTIIDVNDPSKQQVLDMIYDSKDGTYRPNFLKNGCGFWCSAACALGAIAIAASDGPAPFMDALAITYSIACLAACLENEN